MLVKMAEAIGRISLAGREMTRLAGLVFICIEFSRVYFDRAFSCLDTLNVLLN